MRRKWNPFKPNFITAIYLLAITIFFVPEISIASTEKDLHNFNSGKGDGWSSIAGLTFDASGNLYGTALAGGAHSGGIVFQLSPDTDGGWTERVIHSFGGNKEDGVAPRAGLTIDALGNLYGTTTFGGTQKQGVVFELTPLSGGRWQETILHTFGTGNDGRGPYAALVFDTAGNLYGTTIAGGTGFSGGTAFELMHEANGSWKEKVIYNFGNGSDGYSPSGSLIFDNTGSLYGTTFLGGLYSEGTVFKLTPKVQGTWTETILHNFNATYGNAGGYGLYSGLLIDVNGNLYGTTAWGGTGTCNPYGNDGGCGVVFKLTPTTSGPWPETIIREFDGEDGNGSWANVIFDAAGNLYGTTSEGGAYGLGLAFEITP